MPAAAHDAKWRLFCRRFMARVCSRSAGIDFEAPVANTLAIRRGVFVDERSLPNFLQVGRELKLVHVSLAEAAKLAADELLHLVFDLGPRLKRLVVRYENG